MSKRKKSFYVLWLHIGLLKNILNHPPQPSSNLWLLWPPRSFITWLFGVRAILGKQLFRFYQVYDILYSFITRKEDFYWALQWSHHVCGAIEWTMSVVSIWRVLCNLWPYVLRKRAAHPSKVWHMGGGPQYLLFSVWKNWLPCKLLAGF